jgi:hypothetical protein
MAAAAAAAAAAATVDGIREVPLRRDSAASPRVKIVTLPKGTILFRAIYLRDPTEDPNGADLFQDLLGYPVGSDFCLSPIHNVYCFAIPYVGFGLYDWTSRAEAWRKYNAFMVYALTEDTRFVILIRPSRDVRGTPKGWGRGDLIARCDKFPPTECYRALPNAERIARTATFQKAQAWDNCLDPVRRHEEGLGGWIAVAEGDSIDVEEGKGRTARRVPPRNTPMGSYLRSMNDEDFVDTLPHMVVDARGTRGFPEIVVNPRQHSAGLSATLVRRAATFGESIRMVGEDLLAGRLAFAPIATITAAGFYFYDGPGVGFRREGVGANEGPRNMLPEARRRRIEKNSYIFMSRLGKGEVDGLPAMTFDRRTGFFVIGGAGADGRMGLRTGADRAAVRAAVRAADWAAVRAYCVGVKGGVAGSEYLFQRPASIRAVIRDLEIPYEGNSGMARAARYLSGFEGNSRRVGGRDTGFQSLAVATVSRNYTVSTAKTGKMGKNLKNTVKNLAKNSIAKNTKLPTPDIISAESGENLGELYSEIGEIVKSIFI